jgi:hypothetical protein
MMKPKEIEVYWQNPAGRYDPYTALAYTFGQRNDHAVFLQGGRIHIAYRDSFSNFDFYDVKYAASLENAKSIAEAIQKLAGNWGE